LKNIPSKVYPASFNSLEEYSACFTLFNISRRKPENHEFPYIVFLPKEVLEGKHIFIDPGKRMSTIIQPRCIDCST
jgi:hypothetical protein